jgi:hypothetical protein
MVEAKKDIPFVRHAETGQRILLPRHAHFKHPQDEIYDPALHNGHLKCADPECQAPMIHVQAEQCPTADDRSLPRRLDHFRSLRRSDHRQGCTALNYDRGDDHFYNFNAGFRINLGTLPVAPVTHFSDAAHIYRQDGFKRRLISAFQSFDSYEPLSMQKLTEFISFLSNKKSERIRESVVIHKGWFLHWHQFFVRYVRRKEGDTKQPEQILFQQLAQRLDQGMREQPILLELQNLTLSKDGHSYHEKPIALGYDQSRGKMIYMMVTLFDDRTAEDKTHQASLVSSGQPYLYLGYARMRQGETEHSLNYYVNLSWRSSSQLQKCDIFELGRKNKAKNTPKETEPTPALSA